MVLTTSSRGADCAYRFSPTRLQHPGPPTYDTPQFRNTSVMVALRAWVIWHGLALIVRCPPLPLETTRGRFRQGRRNCSSPIRSARLQGLLEEKTWPMGPARKLKSEFHRARIQYILLDFQIFLAIFPAFSGGRRRVRGSVPAGPAASLTFIYFNLAGREDINGGRTTTCSLTFGPVRSQNCADMTCFPPLSRVGARSATAGKGFSPSPLRLWRIFLASGDLLYTHFLSRLLLLKKLDHLRLGQIRRGFGRRAAKSFPVAVHMAFIGLHIFVAIYSGRNCLRCSVDLTCGIGPHQRTNTKRIGVPLQM